MHITPWIPPSLEIIIEAINYIRSFPLFVHSGTTLTVAGQFCNKANICSSLVKLKAVISRQGFPSAILFVITLRSFEVISDLWVDMVIMAYSVSFFRVSDCDVTKCCKFCEPFFILYNLKYPIFANIHAEMCSGTKQEKTTNKAQSTYRC